MLPIPPTAFNPDDELSALAHASKILIGLFGTPPDILYHYTTPGGLKGIIEKKNLWATDIQFLNDRSEFQYGRTICVDELDRVKCSATFKKLCDVVHRTMVDAPPSLTFLAACLCEVDDLVPQWRGYSSSGAGYSIGFRTAPLAEFRDEYAFLRVIYDEAEQRELVQRFLKEFGEAWDETVAKEKDNERRRIIANMAAGSLASGLTMLGLGFKPYMFAYEREWRLVNAITPDSAEFRAKVAFREIHGAIAPYIRLPLTTKSDSLEIESVCIGPTLAEEVVEAGITSFLAYHSIQAEVLRSKAPLRF